ncbi:hypothetical protein G3N55_06865 [Dissulfurirhabdus thermomarina]|uniref:Uncharacterized protein n=1 Tax=Dissulfurirhabdus thermomarina TaxID=1765737 RepID=A0A6N9TMQ4_DISTH|nr:hypothetical protein [Dissulfurirhabdus thermomarina]NDY42562.1 hypothetical protein [Dissulfurirhabdus thermomarina]NMX23171.1 hypothetical protein [Dissulfurirhabdus thermomarina]
MLRHRDLLEFKDYLADGRWEEDFGFRTPDGQAEMLDLVETLFELCEVADEVLTRRLYKQMGGAVEAAGAAVSVEKKATDP